MAPADESVITLGGTGPNGSCQIAVLEMIGFDKEQFLEIGETKKSLKKAGTQIE